MTGWLALWTLLLLLTLVAYAGLALVVTIGGFGDMLEMFRRLSPREPDSGADRHDEPKPDAPASTPPDP